MEHVNEIEVSRRIECEPTAVFPVLRDFEGYPEYSTYLDSVERVRGSDSQSEYVLQFGWWRLTYETRTRVVEMEAPETIEWEVVSDLDASGHWRVSEEADGDGASLTLRIEYDPASVTGNSVSLPFGITLDWVRQKVEPMIHAEARRVLDRIADDLESTA